MPKKRTAKKAKTNAKPKHRNPSRGVTIRDEPRGRRTILTPELQATLVKVIGDGNYDETAYNYAGISHGIFYRWLQRGEKEITRLLEIEEETGEAQEPAPSERIYVDFVEAIKTARAQGEVNDVALLKKHSKKNWQAVMTFLERRYPDRWGRRERHEIGGIAGEPIQVVRRIIVDPPKE